MTRVFTDMEIWVEVRRRVLTGELNKRAACREDEIHWQTLEKILNHSELPGYQKTKPRSSIVDAFEPIIEEILKSDRQVHRKQRHTARRIFERLRDEHAYVGGETIVKDAVRAWMQHHREVFLPLSYPPGEAQVDFGFADVWLAGELTKVALLGMTLPYSEAIFFRYFPGNVPKHSWKVIDERASSSAACRLGSAMTIRRSPWPPSRVHANEKSRRSFSD